MKSTRRALALAGAAVAFAASLSLTAFSTPAQAEYPEKPISYIITFGLHRYQDFCVFVDKLNIPGKP